MIVTVNDQAYEARDGTDVAELLQNLGFAGQRVAVELNREVLPRSLHAQTRLREGDRLEIIRAVGGG
ncbi:MULTISPECIES: sulfur carrier protein ThiS [Acidithiobacillus]|jgi:sulfur carrier protein|uniref:Sulfur carrier protein ThiS n=3 Tax=Acidithiobacillus caldus TaxID=33059 RepID=F9ZR23_ACICS|nr:MULTISPECIES: sulfur carrier protein ThiS [Acidithiobacillus]AEK58327.1 Sulfur carrier protein ThiS [Acidithiobacillus caldus SM-1]AIA55296.1 Sulfur carrier protein ThiS [Acidithiobacillus caldus ATCC 51756]AUW32932.1 sulfur carrier protein ThiS [Acidithiobacillus caldus]MBU2728524.1 sulfur carrier protein ThiS [Acidithiobacillus caldus]MBU2736190.1 sulfur carrier protein ThiS [Acidithiobacillus caldus ATCC 51756]